MVESTNGIEVVKLKAVTLVKEGSLNYLLNKVSSPEDYYDVVKRYVDDDRKICNIKLNFSTKSQKILLCEESSSEDSSLFVPFSIEIN